MADHDAEPQYSRLFVIGVKNIPSKEIEEHFRQCGDVERVHKLYKKDGLDEREDKGMCYVKFFKTSDAARALEDLNQSRIGSSSRPIKVVLATSKDSSMTDLPLDLITKVFIQTSTSATEDEIKREFGGYGNLIRIKRVHDYKTGQYRGFAYVWYEKFSEAANAVENAPKEYRAIFARPMESSAEKRGQMKDGGGGGGYGYGSGSQMGFGPPQHKMGRFDDGGKSEAYNQDAMYAYSGYPHNGCQRLTATMHPQTTLDQATKLFDLIPGLEYCDAQASNFGSTVIAHVKYTRPYCAAYAKDRLDSFEYPPGFMIRVQYAAENQPSAANPAAAQAIQTLTETLKEAASVLRSTGLAQSSDPDLQNLTHLANRLKDSVSANDTPTGGLEHVPHCSVMLPPAQPCLPKQQPACRLFVIFFGPPPPYNYVKDVFSRFGQFIDFYFVRGRSLGYACFMDTECATRAKDALHMQSICDVRAKVVWADERDSDKSTKEERP